MKKRKTNGARRTTENRPVENIQVLKHVELFRCAEAKEEAIRLAERFPFRRRPSAIVAIAVVRAFTGAYFRKAPTASPVN
ncbi:MAG: hypothetical protein PHS52_02295 [Desulfotomaculaceae bacterium]|nr:hypothetical protein [Desulfotomaculaceae bacterium]